MYGVNIYRFFSMKPTNPLDSKASQLVIVSSQFEIYLYLYFAITVLRQESSCLHDSYC